MKKVLSIMVLSAHIHTPNCAKREQMLHIPVDDYITSALLTTYSMSQ